MTMSMTFKSLTAAAILALGATAAQAHGALVSANPAVGSTVGSTSQLKLKFNEPIKPKFSGADLTMTSMMMGGKMMNHTMKVDGVSARVDPKDSKTLLVSSKSRLAPGSYKVSWHVVTGDNHRVTGDYAFNIR